MLYAPGEYQKNPNTWTLRDQSESSVTSRIPHQFENRKLRWIKTDQKGQHTFCSSSSLHRSTRRSRFIERMSRCLLKPLHDATSTAAGVVRPMMETRRTGGLRICRGRELMEQVDETFLGRLPPRFKRFPPSIPTFLFFHLRGKLSTCFCYLLRLKTASRICQILKRTHIMQTSLY